MTPSPTSARQSKSSRFLVDLSKSSSPLYRCAIMTEHMTDRDRMPPPSRRSSSSTHSVPAARTMAATSSASSVASSGLFSAATKAETLRIAGTKCWACSTAAPEICHVVPHHDPQVTPDYPIFLTTKLTTSLCSDPCMGASWSLHLQLQKYA